MSYPTLTRQQLLQYYSWQKLLPSLEVSIPELPALLRLLIPHSFDVLQPEDLAVLGIYDWLRHRHPSAIRSLAMLNAFNSLLRSFAADFTSIYNEGRDNYPPATLSLCDERYAVLSSGSIHCLDLLKSAWRRDLPRNALSILSCDLNVLMLQLAAKIEAVKKLEAHAPDASSPAAQDPGPAGPAGPG